MADDTNLPALEPLERPLSLIPVGLKEAALDSPTFRATALHFSDQIDAIEKWLDAYAKATTKLVAEASSLEAAVTSYLTHISPPSLVSEAVLDHDYSLLAIKKYGEGAREFWHSTLRGAKRAELTAVEPIRAFLGTELKGFKDARRTLDVTQKAFDNVISRYLGQSKTKEPSSLREDAFQLHEARKAYLKASMDFCIAAPNLRASLDKVLVKVFAELWKDMRTGQSANTTMFARTSNDIERVRGWSREMENSERAFKRELLSARKQIEESASAMTKPSRDMEQYNMPYLGTGASAVAGAASTTEKSEKQGWLFLRSVTGKPARPVWTRRWFFVKNGIFGWLVQGSRSGGVEESEKIGVLLCGIRPWSQEERRFCFEVKTKNTSIILQSETPQEMADWISAFEFAKRKALEDPASSTQASTLPSGIDPAFAISPPVAPELTAKNSDGHTEEGLYVPMTEGAGTAPRPSVDVTANRRVMSLEKDPDGPASREHASRIMSKLDLHKRAAGTPPPSAGGIASLISASHNVLPVGPGSPATPGFDGPKRNFTMPSPVSTSTLAPSTLANPPAPTNLSHAAVIVNADRGMHSPGNDGSGTPSGIMANLWGSSNWGYVNRLGGSEPIRGRASSQPASPTLSPLGPSQDDVGIMDGMISGSPDSMAPKAIGSPSTTIKHRKTRSEAIVEDGSPDMTRPASSGGGTGTIAEEYPNYYPLPLKAQHAQFQALFPSAPRKEKVVLVFRATWNPTEQQEFPGRVYVTTQEIYFYSNHLGLVLITGVRLDALVEVTAAPGRDCDFLYLLLREAKGTEVRRITVKVFLEPLRLLQRRLDYLVQNANSDKPEGIEDVLKALIRMEVEVLQRSSSAESWEDINFGPDEASAGDPDYRNRGRSRNVKASLHIDGNLYGDATARTGREVLKFKLPAQPVNYAPQGMQASITRDFNVSAKALFHVMFGDKSAVFQLLYVNRWAEKIVQTPWIKTSTIAGSLATARWSRAFETTPTRTVADTQTIDILNDHLCYVITNTKLPSRLPYSSRFRPTTKLVITHTSKSRCKLAIFQRITWNTPPSFTYVKHLIETQALTHLEADALDLTNVTMDQVARLGNHSKTNRAIDIFGNIGALAQSASLDSSAPSPSQLPATTRKHFALWRLILNDVFVQILSLLGWAMDLLFAAVKAAIGACTAHSTLITLLTASALYNTWHAYRSGVQWHQDRAAAKFMGRLGVGVAGGMSMGRAVYIADIDTLIGQDGGNATGLFSTTSPSSSFTPDDNSSGNSKSCSSTFAEQLALPASSPPTTNGQSTRFTRSLASLATYRHDLLIALRVVNRVERDIVSAEWERWVEGEVGRCAGVEEMLSRRRLEGDDGEGGAGGKGKVKGKKDGKVDGGVGEEVLERELGREFVEYCRGCRDVRSEMLENGSGSLSSGGGVV